MRAEARAPVCGRHNGVAYVADFCKNLVRMCAMRAPYCMKQVPYCICVDDECPCVVATCLQLKMIMRC